MTRHSNMLVFGTNTAVGIKVGTGSANVPEISVGFTRQEMVLMPLVANVTDNGKYQSPCNMLSATTAPASGKSAVHPCLLVGINGSASDSYSVLASFGGRFKGSKEGGGSADGGVAQYFSTGIAAQLLAQNGGASVVAVGAAPVASAQNRPNAAATEALFTSPEAAQRVQPLVSGYDNFRAQFIAYINSLPEGTSVADKVEAFEKSAGIGVASSIKSHCTTAPACTKFIEESRAYGQDYLTHHEKLEAALTAARAN